MSRFVTLSFAVLLLAAWSTSEVRAQFLQTWVDIGEMQSRYSEVGAHPEGPTGNRSIEWPSIIRGSGHYRSKAYWIGLKNWTDEFGRQWEYHNARVGPRPDGSTYFTPIETRLIAKWEDTEVFVDGAASFDKIAIVDEVDPGLVADRVLYQKYRTNQGVETERTVYAYSNQVHDDFHIIHRKMTNTGNTDGDDEIELDGQTLNDVFFFNVYRWRGRSQAAWHMSVAQTWGKFSMVDIVGDGNGDYPVDFTATYLWGGQDPNFDPGWDELGSPMLRDANETAPGDTIGRLAGMSMQGRIVLHADNSTTDRGFTPPGYDGAGNPIGQPATLGWIDTDEPLNADGQPERDYYELAILTRENPAFVDGGASRMFPHYADRIEPTGEFWTQQTDASTGKQGGHASTVAYGPYQMAFGESVNIWEAEGAAGLSYEAATDVGVAWKQAGFDDALRIPFDANGDGQINDVPYDYSVYQNGSELMTKNQWFLSSRDSMFQMMYRARDVFQASAEMTQYPIVQPPRPPRTFEVTGLPDKIELKWETIAGEPDPVEWEIYRTDTNTDKLPYELVTTLPGSARGFDDVDLIRGVDYYYFIQAVGPANNVDPLGLTGTPSGLPLKSGRYFTQTYTPTTLKRPPGATAADFRIVPSVVNLAADETVRFIVGGDPTRSQVNFFDIPGNSTITIYTETGEFVKRIEHTDGSGDDSWNLTTDSRQPIVSGIYLVRVVNNDNGDTDLKKMVVIQ